MQTDKMPTGCYRISPNVAFEHERRLDTWITTEQRAFELANEELARRAQVDFVDIYFMSSGGLETFIGRVNRAQPEAQP